MCTDVSVRFSLGGGRAVNTGSAPRSLLVIVLCSKHARAGVCNRGLGEGVTGVKMGNTFKVIFGYG